MAVAFVQSLGSAQSKTAGTSLATSTSLTLTAGNVVVVAFAADDVGSAFSCSDNLGNTYALQKTTVNAGHCKVLLFSGPVVTGGTLTAITVQWTTNVTAKAVAAGEFSGVDSTVIQTDGATASSANVTGGSTIDPVSGDLVVLAGAAEDNFPDLTVSTVMSCSPATLTSNGKVDANGTDGGGSASNISAALWYGIVNAGGTDTTPSGSFGVAGEVNAGAAASFHVAAAVAATPGLDDSPDSALLIAEF